MKITVNGTAQEVSAGTLEALLTELAYGGKVATAVNGAFVAAGARAACALQAGDQVEILAPQQGG